MVNLNKILDEGITISSSGTTGTPKSIFQSPKKLKAANSVAREVQSITKNSSIYTVCTLDHAGGLLAQTLPGYEIGCNIDIEKFNPYTWVSKIQKYTHSHLTPGMAEAIIKTKSFKKLNLSGITIMCGSDKVKHTVAQLFIDQGATFIINWGMTEIGPVAINKTYRPGDITIPGIILGDTKYCDYKIVDNELWVKGDICVYDDWYATKDVVLENNGCLFYKGRINDFY